MPLPTPELRIDRDAVLWSAGEKDRGGRPLLVLLHGYGSDEADLFGISAYLPLEPVIASLRAPIPEGPGFAWFSRFTNVTTDPLAGNADAAARAVLDWLDEQPVTPTGLLGFSQGGAMALQLLRLAPERFDYAVQLSGFMVQGEHAGDADLAREPVPVFWGRGTHDDTIPPSAVDRTARWLPGHSALDARIYEGLGHGISSIELGDISTFIRAQLTR
ncbi:phospholipase/carboxylesterase [Leifsonia sp. LS1]|uniref:alpha/beta hydrolase n=1 Tax=unclassified Leifsonia TaxID=2663824 RepID=UPI001CBD78AC|nr:MULTISPECIES: alpha/beta hydrolase-fold protein [unclassified Leifsonia]UAJ78790.1 dienelactone hydrolase family protein [Leifsonia sp. ZF2019]GIT79834.1 phospholipase/carboxylesterase [Leifsonia sp. LS1]